MFSAEIFIFLSKVGHLSMYCRYTNSLLAALKQLQIVFLFFAVLFRGGRGAWSVI